MKIVIFPPQTKKITIQISAQTRKAFADYAKMMKTIDYEAEYNINELIQSWVDTFADSEEFKNIAKEAATVKEELEAEKAKAKAEREAKAAEKKAAKEQKLLAKKAEIEKQIAELNK